MRISTAPARGIHYLHDGQKQRVEQLRSSWLWRSQLPTWLVIVSIYGGWFAVLTHVEQLGKPLSALLLVLLLTWYMSLQHELVHGHPTRWPAVNRLLGMAPLALWFPFGLYRDSHRAHHRNEQITCPERDPESYFVSASHWQSCGGVRRVLLKFRNTIVGRLLIGPVFSVAGTVRDEWKRIASGEVRIAGRWLLHG
ncbi:fatty acid desaturase, partial [Steroidobacter sp.]|uniref:fatty acid desaturase n=1 Tax=Steroidobacter sp. TaxID=1978227 RepID=UPI001A3DE8ED